MIVYTLATEGETHSGTVPFRLFRLFYQALQTVESIESRHYSEICYRFGDGIQTTYRMGTNPVSTPIQEDSVHPVSIFTCVQRPGLCVHATAVPTHETNDFAHTTVRTNTFRTLVSTVLHEHWSYTIGKTIYHLTKSGSGKTKERASQATPVFTIAVTSDSPAVIHDLFGRFNADGQETTLMIRSSLGA